MSLPTCIQNTSKSPQLSGLRDYFRPFIARVVRFPLSDSENTQHFFNNLKTLSFDFYYCQAAHIEGYQAMIRRLNNSCWIS